MQGREMESCWLSIRTERDLSGLVSDCSELALPTPKDGAEDALEVSQRTVCLLQRWGV